MLTLFRKGSLWTIDRSFGPLINHLHHNIETHVVHHMFFTAIPHYHLVEATEAVKPLLGKHYIFDPTHPFVVRSSLSPRCFCSFRLTLLWISGSVSYNGQVWLHRACWRAARYLQVREGASLDSSRVKNWRLLLFFFQWAQIYCA